MPGRHRPRSSTDSPTTPRTDNDVPANERLVAPVMARVPVMEPMSVPVVEPVSLMKPLSGLGALSGKLVDITAVPGVEAAVMRVRAVRVRGVPPVSVPGVTPGVAQGRSATGPARLLLAQRRCASWECPSLPPIPRCGTGEMRCWPPRSRMMSGCPLICHGRSKRASYSAPRAAPGVAGRALPTHGQRAGYPRTGARTDGCFIRRWAGGPQVETRWEPRWSRLQREVRGTC
jgi:hypothetical protein